MLKQKGFNEKFEDTELYSDHILEELVVQDIRADKDLLPLQYLNEVWITTLGGTENYETQQICAEAVDGNWEAVHESLKKCDFKESPEHNKQKLQNLMSILEEYFLSESAGCDMASPGMVERNRMTAEFVKATHRKVMHRLIDKPGHFREKSAGPCGYSFFYLSPQKIAGRLNTLLSATESHMESIHKSTSMSYKEKIKTLSFLGALFFSEFLFIHPFPNGNGRTARILLNLMLCQICKGPFSLYISTIRSPKKPCDVYLEKLSSIHQCMANDSCHAALPDEFASYILLCLQRHVSQMRYHTMDDN